MINTHLLGLSIDDLKQYIGKRVRKTTSNKSDNPKPFKSGFKTNTIKDVTIHPILFIPAFTFEEDSSWVEARRCVIL